MMGYPACLLLIEYHILGTNWKLKTGKMVSLDVSVGKLPSVFTHMASPLDTITDFYHVLTPF